MVVTIAAAVALIVILTFLALILKRLVDVEGAVARAAVKPPAAAPAAVAGGDDRLATIEDRVRTLHLVLERIEATLRDRPMATPAPPGLVEAQPSEAATSVPLVAPPPPPADQRVDPVAAPTPPPDPAHELQTDPDVQRTDPDALLDSYRDLIAHPRKNEINAWVDAASGEGCEMAEDGIFALVPRESGPLLVLVPFSERAAIVVPSARLVLDFATSFADTLALRPVLRQSFELSADGSGILRLVQAALATRTGGIWRLHAPGRLTGLST